jgi:hypothetical protein
MTDKNSTNPQSKISDVGILQPWHYWGQRTEWGPNFTTPPERFLDCWAMSLSMALKFASGITVPAYFIHNEVIGSDNPSEGTLDNLQWALKVIAETDSRIISGNAVGVWEDTLRRYVSHGLPVIELRDFQTVGNAEKHFMVVHGYKPHGILSADPWEGGPLWESDQDHYAISNKIAVVVLRKRMLGDHFTHP